MSRDLGWVCFEDQGASERALELLRSEIEKRDLEHLARALNRNWGFARRLRECASAVGDAFPKSLQFAHKKKLQRRGGYSTAQAL